MYHIPNLMIFSDFDGTITSFDMAEYILTKFAKSGWETYVEKFDRGEITIEECVNLQFSTVNASKKDILEELSKVASFRPGFGDFAAYCQNYCIPIIIVSAGLDFVIRHFLNLKGWNNIRVHTGKSSIGGGSIRMAFPGLTQEGATSFKDDLVIRYKGLGNKIAYIGDGISDYNAAKKSNIIFAVKNSKLAHQCSRSSLAHFDFMDFYEIIEILKKRIT